MPFPAGYSEGQVTVKSKISNFEFDVNKCLSDAVWAQKSDGAICFAVRRLELAKNNIMLL